MQTVNERNHSIIRALVTVFLLAVVLVAGGYLRYLNLAWDEGFHLHPDERFLSMVLNSMQPVGSLGEYFDTQTSALNPNNHGFTFFVYGTFPLFIIRYVGEWVGQIGYDPITIVGRQLSASADFLTIILVFLIAYKLYNERAGLIAAALYAFAVLPIQQAHFLTVDTFTNTFGMLTVLAAVLILKSPYNDTDEGGWLEQGWRYGWRYLLFGLGLGMATASKINAVSLALLLPLVELVRYLGRKDHEERYDFIKVIVLVIAAAVVSILTFRLLQPYAFAGPGFLNMGINQDWWNGLKSLQAQATGEVDFPPALQWTRRPATFSLYNMLFWGVGLPWGIMAVLSWFGMAIKIFKRKAYLHLPLWTWSLVYFAWQGLAWVSSMRYLLLLYPFMAIFAAWGLDWLLSAKTGSTIRKFTISSKTFRTIGVVLTVLVLTCTAVWAFAFSRIYTRPVTRVQATDWIYENLEGPINLVIETVGEELNFPVQYRAVNTLSSGEKLTLLYEAKADGFLTDLSYPVVQSVSDDPANVQYQLRVIDVSSGQDLTEESLVGQNPQNAEGNVQTVLDFQFNPAIYLLDGDFYQFELTLLTDDSQAFLSGVPVFTFYYDDGLVRQDVLPKINETIFPRHAYEMTVHVHSIGTIKRVELPSVLDMDQQQETKQLKLTLLADTAEGTIARTAVAEGDFLGDGAKGEKVVFQLQEPPTIDQPIELDLIIELAEGEGQIMVNTPGIALESSWDDGLPLSRPGFTAYQDNAGIYRGDLNFEMYWPDDASKLQRFYSVLTQADTIIMSSNRQFGTIPRVPERYPLSTFFYRQLLGCPEEQDTLVCYYEAESGQSGTLGFDLVKTFTSYPTLGSIEFNDQYAEEAFSVYDHPKVLIFRKNESFDSEAVWALLNSVDIDSAVFLTPRQADSYVAGAAENNLMLTEEELQIQQEGGTWSELFDRDSLLNRQTWLAVLAFYLLFWLLGLAVFPIVRLALPGLKDKGYAFARIIGLLLFALVTFNLGSIKVPVTRTLLWIVLAGILILSVLITWLTRKGLSEDVKRLWKQFLVEEAVFLVAFAFFLWIRYQNPDLWHPWRGGEKPMDFSFLNAVIKSSVFPAYDPWYAGGYINYYYYGQVLVALPIKLLGVVPAVSYNILISLWYAMLVIGAFSIGWNLAKAVGKNEDEKLFGEAFWAGVCSALLLAFVGNLGEIKVIADGLAALGAAGVSTEGATLSQKLVWWVRGIAMTAQGERLPIASGNWYWNPSRMIPGEPITEFPFFTFLYADFHAHLIAMPIVMAAVSWCLSLVMLRKKDGKLTLRILDGFLPILVIGGVVLGALQPTNTWDYLTFTALAMVVIIYIGWRYLPGARWRFLPEWTRRWIYPLAGVVAVLLLSRVFYHQFNSNFFSGYGSVGFWNGPRTPLAAYFLHWGLILFLITSWLLWETYRWMASTRLSQLKVYEKHRKWLIALAGLIVVAFLILLLLKVTIALVALPLGVLALFLMVISDDDARRLAYFMIGTGLVLTLVVELVYLVGDIGRMNVVFKLYHQAWMLLTLPLGLVLVILWRDLPKWRTRWQIVFQVFFVVLLFSALLFPALATKDKITDRMDPAAAHTLDGMKYMETSEYFVNGVTMDLGQDYRAIQWMQENVEGSPVILEAQAYEYYWGNRYTVYTGLPAVVGWNYHQRQQRAILRNNAVQERVDEVNAFYMSMEPEFIEEYLQKYRVGYVIVGQQEMAFYPPEALAKFETYDGQLWDLVYSQDETNIYKVR